MFAPVDGERTVGISKALGLREGRPGSQSTTTLATSSGRLAGPRGEKRQAHHSVAGKMGAYKMGDRKQMADVMDAY